MDLYDAAERVSELLESGRSVYLRTEPEAPDFTIKATFKIIIWGQMDCVELEANTENIVELVAMFDCTVFDKSAVDRLYAWNIKSLASYFHYVTKKFFTITTQIIDLKPIEGFLGNHKTAPQNLAEAVNRTRTALQSKGWQAVYKAVHLPLSLRVLPVIETTPLLNEPAKRTEHPYYEIEGQASGRMNSFKKFSRCYRPHNMDAEVRHALKPRGYGMRFIYSDYHYCEVAVLQWLSGDAVLKGMIDSDRDLYAQIYEAITNDPCDTDSKRKKAKKTLISMMYGIGSSSLAESIGVPQNVAAELIRRITVVIPTACEWLDQRQEQAKHGAVLDFFNRPRSFTEPYKARNFSIQGVAATVCHEKLIELEGAVDGDDVSLAFSVHDGVGLVCKVAKAREAYKLVKSVMESESKLCPGLKMKASIQFGAKLDAMKVLWKD